MDATWKATRAGAYKHLAKDRFPMEAICGKVLTDDRKTTGMERCPLCSRILANQK